jgi:hypothetical protein
MREKRNVIEPGRTPVEIGQEKQASITSHVTVRAADAVFAELEEKRTRVVDKKTASPLFRTR